MTSIQAAAQDEDAGSTPAAGGSQIAVIGKAAQVLEALLRRPDGGTPSQIAADLEINRSTAFRLLTSLERSRLLDRDAETGRYRLGLRLLAYGDAVRARIDVVAVADPVLRRLRDEVRLSVYLAIRNGGEAVCLKRLPGPEVDVLAWKPGQSLPLHRGAAPRALLAALPDAELAAYLAEPADRSTLRGPMTADDVRQLVAAIRHRGWSFNGDELTPGVSSIGVALRGPAGSGQHAISVAGLSGRFTGDDRAAIAAAVTRAAARIDDQIGAPIGGGSG